MGAILKGQLSGVVLTLCLVAIGCSLFCVPTAQAVPVWGELFELEQPDGSRVEVLIWGDEFYRVVESLDGYTLVRDPRTGVICYARLSADGNELESTGIRLGSVNVNTLGVEPHIRINPEASRAIIREARAYAAQGDREVMEGLNMAPQPADPPSSGNVEAICLLIDFSDEPSTIAASEIDDYCNLPGYTGYGNNGSVRDYFYAVSDGNLTYTNFVPTAYYRAAQPKSYYDDCGAPYGSRTRELIIEALTDLDNNGFDFSQYDANGDGLVDGINCFYAGVTGCGWANGLWPHSWTVDFAADGVETFKYQVTGLRPTGPTLSTFCHENGHMLCYWPDLYDYDTGLDDSYGVGRFCIMCASTSATNPQEPCAYLKDFSGWATTTLLNTPHTEVTVPSNSNTIFKYEHPTLANEFYLIENRQKIGRDSGLPDDGLAIWHIDTNGNNSNNQMTPELHYLVTLVQADGDWDLENDVNIGDQTDLWSSPTHTDCTPLTTPNTNWWDGSASDLYVTDISASSTSMTFMFSPMCDVAPQTLDFGLVALGDSLDLTFTIYNLDASPLVGSVSETCDHFIFASGETYNIPPGGTHDVTVRYKPTITGMHDCTIDTGSADCGEVYCTGESFVRNCIVEPDTLDFGTVAVGTFTQLSFKIRNDGTEVLSGNLTHACTGFIVPTTSYVLSPGDSIFVTVMFLPQTLGPYECVIDTDYGLCKDVVCIGTAGDLDPPPPPDGFDVAFSNTTGSLLTWNSSPASDFDMFKVYRSGNSELLLDAPLDTTWQEVYATADTSWTDPVADGWMYQYAITALDDSGNESLPSTPTVLTGIAGDAAPLKYALHQSVPNPFNPTTTISYTVPAGGGLVTIRVFDVAGRLVRTLVNSQAPAGPNTVTWDGRNDRGENVATGIFFCRMQAPGFEQTMKMTLLK